MHMLIAKLGTNSKMVKSSYCPCLMESISPAAGERATLSCWACAAHLEALDWMWSWMDGFHRFPLVDEGQVMCGGKIAVLGCWCSWHQSYRVLLYLSCESIGFLSEGFPLS